MLKASKGKILPTAIIGSLPRPSWYTENLGTKSFVDAMANNKFREQYVDALNCYLKDQEVAGLDIVAAGDCRFDQGVAGAREVSDVLAGTSCTTISKPESCRRSSVPLRPERCNTPRSGKPHNA